ncbi:hypothetical protein BDQ12DRAFT_67819 [Crucibulum laeve]|uniref:Uncharacterized protein n=1 Tax=Crucibulum laeve TaxID=68775 RepID=A0A5C3LH17_9AGAR|nr:hypothetical protein BDQ12DRAFT_67819 [Crucibulum laeve]
MVRPAPLPRPRQPRIHAFLLTSGTHLLILRANYDSNQLLRTRRTSAASCTCCYIQVVLPNSGLMSVQFSPPSFSYHLHSPPRRHSVFPKSSSFVALFFLFVL